MGLDAYAYRAKRAGQREDFYEGAAFNGETREFENPDVEKPEEIAYWRKHPGLHDFMKNAWENAGNTGEFNGDELELTLDILYDLELAVKSRCLRATPGFFFGSDSSEYYHDTDLKFIGDARQAISEGDLVFYNSSW